MHALGTQSATAQSTKEKGWRAPVWVTWGTPSGEHGFVRCTLSTFVYSENFLNKKLKNYLPKIKFY